MKDHESRLSQLMLLKEIADMLNQGMDLPFVLQRVLNQLLRALHLESGWVFLQNEQKELQLAASINLPPALQNETYKPMCGQNCYCIERFHNGRLQKAVNVLQCKRLQAAIEFDYGETFGLVHHASVALQSGNEFFGILNVALSSKELFGQEELTLLESVALQIGSAIKRIRLTEKNRRLAVTEERNRLAQELHDSVKQLIFSMNLLAKTGVFTSQEQEAKRLFNEIATIAQAAQAEMKALIWQLRPQELKKGLVRAIKDYAEMLGMTVETDENTEILLPGEVEEELWRIAQEAINNCKKHSGTSHIHLKCCQDNNGLVLQIIDYGRGFCFNPEAELLSLGLHNMINRAKKLNGEVHVESAIDKGTKVTVSVPI